MKAFRRAFCQFTLLCDALDLFSGELVAIDGTKIKGVNSLYRNYSKSVLQKKLKEINERIDEYLKDIEESDNAESEISKLTDGELKEKIESLESRKDEYKRMLDTLEQTGESQISLRENKGRVYTLHKACFKGNMKDGTGDFVCPAKLG